MGIRRLISPEAVVAIRRCIALDCRRVVDDGLTNLVEAVRISRSAEEEDRANSKADFAHAS